MKNFLILIILLLGINNAFAEPYIKIFLIKNNYTLYVDNSEYKNLDIKESKGDEIWYDNKDVYLNGDAKILLKDRNFIININGQEVWVNNKKMNHKDILILENRVIDGGFINEFE